MKTVKVMECGWDLKLLYKEAILTKPRRGLFGYMIRTGRCDNTILGGSFYLLQQLEPVWGKEAYHLKLETNSATAREIIAMAEFAMAGGLNRFAPSRREMSKTIKALDGIEI